jgi:hypothetical protein
MPAYDVLVTETASTGPGVPKWYNLEYVISDTLYSYREAKRHPLLMRPGSQSSRVICPVNDDLTFYTGRETTGSQTVVQESIATPRTILAARAAYSECFSNTTVSTWGLAATVSDVADYAVGVRWQSHRPRIFGGLGAAGAVNEYPIVLTLSQAVLGCTRLVVRRAGIGDAYLLRDTRDSGCTFAWNGSGEHDIETTNGGTRTGDGTRQSVQQSAFSALPIARAVNLVLGSDGKWYSPMDYDITSGGNFVVFSGGANGYEAVPQVRGVMEVLTKDGAIETRYSAWVDMDYQDDFYGTPGYGSYKSFARLSQADDICITNTYGEVKEVLSGVDVITHTDAIIDSPYQEYLPGPSDGYLAMPIINPPGLTEKIWPAIYRDVTP